jgi:hypothetical protein
MLIAPPRRSLRRGGATASSAMAPAPPDPRRHRQLDVVLIGGGAKSARPVSGGGLTWAVAAGAEWSATPVLGPARSMMPGEQGGDELAAAADTELVECRGPWGGTGRFLGAVRCGCPSDAGCQRSRALIFGWVGDLPHRLAGGEDSPGGQDDLADGGVGTASARDCASAGYAARWLCWMFRLNRNDRHRGLRPVAGQGDPYDQRYGPGDDLLMFDMQIRQNSLRPGTTCEQMLPRCLPARWSQPIGG